MLGAANLGQMLVFLRKRQGWTQEDMAKRLGTRQQVIRRIEKNPESASLGMLRRISSELGEPLGKVIRCCEKDAA